ncbi:BTB/POZ domain-containing protein [Rhizophagus irregularis DAOM 181602=DAOM 197198]|nr:BTB/POZ domain-containing protein [Rhizophagus irregularis DAOM 181602=DAOM 197198]
MIWDNLIKWSFDQHPSIQKDAKKWNKEEITIMERTLHNFIPLIRFYHMSSEGFLLKELNIKIQPPRNPNMIRLSLTANILLTFLVYL